MNNIILMAVLGIVILVSGCANNQYNLADQPDYRDSLNNAHDRVANSGERTGNN
jgi:outer membrane murein-binding lipoprotein Lpp